MLTGEVKEAFDSVVTERVDVDGDTEISINGELVWNDCAPADYPEDLIWSRDISELAICFFKAGYQAGKKP